jgi:endonuclease III
MRMQGLSVQKALTGTLMVVRKARKSQAEKSLRVAELLEEHLGHEGKPRRRPGALDTLIATVLSQNTNDQNSYRAWLNLRKQFPTWEKVSAAPWKSLARAIEVGGLKNQKAQRIKKIVQRIYAERGEYSLEFLKEKSNEEIVEYLLSMKGVGKKTAACVLVFSLGRDVFPVDTHIHRICNRLGLVRTKSPDRTYDEMQNLVPRGKAYAFHVNLIRFGRETCKSARPQCGGCPLFDLCVFPEKDRLAAASKGRRHTSDGKTRFLITEQVSRDQAG